jgi:hypothetical protein
MGINDVRRESISQFHIGRVRRRPRLTDFSKSVLGHLVDP